MTLRYYDRSRAFVISDEPNLGQEVFVATKTVKSGRNTDRNPDKRFKMTAVAIRERGTQHFSRILRFGFSLPSDRQSVLNSWVAVPAPSKLSPTSLFFSSAGGALEATATGDGSLSHEAHISVVESWVLAKCVVLTLGQRCYDWFLLRQFRITGTIAGQILLADAAIRAMCGLHARDPTDMDDDARKKDLFERLCSSWFSSARSTEAMKRGTVNEGAIASAIAAHPSILGVFEVGMLSRKDNSGIACSCDLLVLFRLPNGDVVIASVEMKSGIADSSVDRLIDLVSPEVIFCELGDETFSKWVPEHHIGQLLDQMVVVSLKYALYVAAGENGLAFILVVHASDNLLAMCLTRLRDACCDVIDWLHSDSVHFPSFVGRELRTVIQSRLQLWKLVNKRVLEQFPFRPLKLIKHGCQSWYSATKCGVDQTAQARAVLRSSTSALPWEQKMVIQVLKSVAVNAHVGWRINERKDVLDDSTKFISLQSYRNMLNKVCELSNRDTMI